MPHLERTANALLGGAAGGLLTGGAIGIAIELDRPPPPNTVPTTPFALPAMALGAFTLWNGTARKAPAIPRSYGRVPRVAAFGAISALLLHAASGRDQVAAVGASQLARVTNGQPAPGSPRYDELFGWSRPGVGR